MLLDGGLLALVHCQFIIINSCTSALMPDSYRVLWCCREEELQLSKSWQSLFHNQTNKDDLNWKPEGNNPNMKI